MKTKKQNKIGEYPFKINGEMNRPTKKPNKVFYTLPTQIERDAYSGGQQWGIKKTLQALKKEVEKLPPVEMGYQVETDTLYALKQGYRQALSQVIKLIEKYEERC